MSSHLSNKKCSYSKEYIHPLCTHDFCFACVIILNTCDSKCVRVEDYGIYNVVAGFVSLFAFLNSSMTNTIQRFFNYERGRNDANSLNKVYITSFQIQFLLGIITFVLLEIVGVWYISTKMILPVERLSAAMCVFHFSVISACSTNTSNSLCGSSYRS